MADVVINKFTTQILRDGATPSSPGFVVSEGQDPVNPPGTNNFVPYSGAISNVELGEYGLESGFITLDTTPTGTPVDQGTIYWDDSKSTAALIMNGTTQHIGQDTYFYVKNSSGSNIAKGVAVRFDGTDGASGHLLIAPFLADGTYPSAYFMGVTAEAIDNGEFGQVTNFGEIEGIDTSIYSAGDLLYASTTSAGAFQTTAPVAPNNIVLIAAAVNSKNNGAIIVRPTYGSNINDDEGVKIVSPTTGDLLQLQASGLWENKTKAQVLGGTSSQFVKGDGSLDSTSYQPLLTNPVTGTGTTNYLPKFTGASTIGNSVIYEISGAIGINTISPYQAKLDVVGVGGTGSVANIAASNSNLDQLLIGSINRGAAPAFFSLPNGSAFVGAIGNGLANTLGIGTFGAAPLIFGTFNTERMRIFSDGNVGINTGSTNAGYKLDVNGTGRFSGNGFFGGATTFAGLNGGISVNGTSNSGINFRTGDVLRGYVYTTSGNMWVETVSGNVILAPNGSPALTMASTGAATFTFDNNSSGVVYQRNVSGTIYELGSVKNSGSNILYQGTGNVFINADSNSDSTSTDRNVIFGNRGVEYMRLTSGGNLLVNTSTDSGYKLDVNGTGRFSSSVGVGGSISGNYPLTIRSSVADYTKILDWGTSVGGSWGTMSINVAAPYNTIFNSGGFAFTGGNVGIGTTSPAYRLVVNSATDGISAGISGNTYGIRFDNGGTFSPGMSTIHGVNNTLIGSYQPIMLNGLDVRFGTSANERMRITSSGNVLVGTTTDAGQRFQVSGSGIITHGNSSTLTLYHNTANDNNVLFLRHDRAAISGETGKMISFNAGATQVGSITSNNSSTSYNTSSDYRLKEDLKQVNGLEKINAINVYNYKWKSSQDRMDGVLAHELAKILPYAVTGKKDGKEMQGVDYSKIVPLLIQSIKELKQEIDTLKN